MTNLPTSYHQAMEEYGSKVGVPDVGGHFIATRGADSHALIFYERVENETAQESVICGSPLAELFRDLDNVKRANLGEIKEFPKEFFDHSEEEIPTESSDFPWARTLWGRGDRN